jgi:hypothetical protein
MLVWVLFALTLVSTLHAMLGAAWVPVSDPDVWWVAAAGRQLLATHTLPSQNLFSFVEPTRPWIMHEWLLGPPYALGLSTFGPAFFVVVAVAALGSGLILILGATLGRARHALAGALLACVSTLFFLRRLQTARPSSVSLLFPLLLTALAFGPTFTVGRLIACILCEWLWANVHGSFPIGILLLLAAAIEQPRDRARRLLAAGGAAVASLLNPYGVRLHGFVWSYFSGQAGIYREIHAAIPEFSSMVQAWGSLITLPELLGFGIVAAMAVAAALRAEHRWRGLLCLVLLSVAARQARHLELAGLVSCMLLVPWADEWVARWSMPQREEAHFRRRLLLWILGPTYALALCAFILAWAQRRPADWLSEEYAFLGSLASVAASAHLYVPFHGAGLAIWYGYPRGIRVFYDSRNDCYSVETLRAYAKLGKAQATNAAQKRAREILDASDTNAVLIPATHPLTGTLTEAPDWALVERSPGYLFRRIRPAPARPTSLVPP